MRARVSAARIARLATLIAGSGAPHQVPVCFALEGDTAYSVVDATPRTTLGLRRLDNIAADSRASLLVDHYADDWDGLWWVRLDVNARIVADAVERGRALTVLRRKYPQYRDQVLSGAVLAFDILNWAAWAAWPATQ